MPRDECRDCGRPITNDSADFDGRCLSCYQAFLQRQEPAEKAPTSFMETEREA